jgi:hypothetical protein
MSMDLRKRIWKASVDTPSHHDLNEGGRGNFIPAIGVGLMNSPL